MYKPSEGVLWVYNRTCMSRQWFKEIPNAEKTEVIENKVDESREQKDIEEDEENDVDLERSMWIIVRKKESINKVLKDFCP